MKVCTRCTRWKPMSAYYRDARNTDGHAGSCIECQRAAALQSWRSRYVPRGTMAQARDEAGRFARA